MRMKRMVVAVALAAAAAGTAYLVVKALEQRRIANVTAGQIEADVSTPWTRRCGPRCSRR